ncbi:MAG: hypothetical protein HFH82_16535 [Lachnospiraceae bacterium]|nr:hypothetical protein [Lachnospiraceae bacterium]
MDDSRRLTVAVEHEIQSKWVNVMADSTKELSETSGQVLAYLRDRESQHTSDYIIRRYIQNCYPKLLEKAQKQSGESYADLNKNKNIAWEPDFNQALSEYLYKEFADVISRKQWLEYLTDHKRIHRKQLFKIALILGMDVETTQKLLMACGKEPYNLHSAFDVICLYCQQWDKNNAYEAALNLYEEYKKRVDVKAAAQEMRKSNAERSNFPITSFVHNLIRSSANDREFLEELVRNSCEFTGYSEVLRGKYLCFACYLSVLYPEYTYSYVESREKDPVSGRWITKKEEKTVPISFEAEEMVVLEREAKGCIKDKRIPNMNQLLTAMFQDSFWFSGNKEHGKKEKHIVKVQKDTGGLIQTFCNNYKERCMKIVKKEISVDRQDILLFSFFFLSHYLYLPVVRRNAVKAEFDCIGIDETRLDQAIRNVLVILDEDVNYREEAFETVIKCMNLILRSCDLAEVYLPNPFDRFVVLALLSRAPLAVTSIILESIKNEREEGTLEV